MIPYSYNMVDMGGVDLAEVNGTVVPGIYSRIVGAVNSCGDAILYNWKFASIEITPQYVQILLGETSLIINGAIQVTELDEVTIIGIEPPTPSPTIVNINITENGTYNPQDYNADGFGVVSVNVSGGYTSIEAVHVWTNSTGGYDASVYVQEGHISGYEFIPDGEAESVLYTTVRQTPREFDLISLAYVSQWRVTAKDDLIYNYIELLSGNSITWNYSTRVDYVFILKGE